METIEISNVAHSNTFVEKAGIELFILDAFRAGDVERLSALTPCEIKGIDESNRFMRPTVC